MKIKGNEKYEFAVFSYNARVGPTSHSTQPNPTHEWTQPMSISEYALSRLLLIARTIFLLRLLSNKGAEYCDEHVCLCLRDSTCNFRRFPACQLRSLLGSSLAAF